MLKTCGIRGTVNGFINAFPSNIKHIVEQENSSYAPVASGIMQASIICLVLFLH